MSNILILNQSFITVGLGTLTYTVPTSGLYNVEVALTEVPPSGLSVLVKKNTVTQYTMPFLGLDQIAQQFKFDMSLAAADVVDVVFASSDDIDKGLNNVKAQVSIGQGY